MNKLLILTILTLSFNSHAILNVLRKKKVFLDRGCTQETNFKRAKKACKSGLYNGQTIHQCVKKRKGWEHQLERRCPGDGGALAVYVNSCHGQNSGFQSVMQGCASNQFNGKTLVKCRAGKEVQRLYCGQNAGNDEKKEVAVFLDACSGEKTEFKRNLNKACKKYPNRMVVRCKNKCAQRGGIQDGFKCKKRVWKEIKSKYCQEVGGPVVYDLRKLTFKSCNPEEKAKIGAAIIEGQKKVHEFSKELDKAIISGQTTFDYEFMEKLKKAKAITAKINVRLLNKRLVFVCNGASKYCSTVPIAHTIGIGNNFGNIKFCGKFFTYDEKERMGTLIHEISHNHGTFDDIDFGAGNPPKDGKKYGWEKNAETYEYWAEHGFCIPTKSC